MTSSAYWTVTLKTENPPDTTGNNFELQYPKKEYHTEIDVALAIISQMNKCHHEDLVPLIGGFFWKKKYITGWSIE